MASPEQVVGVRDPVKLSELRERLQREVVTDIPTHLDTMPDALQEQWRQYLAKNCDPAVLKCELEPPPGVDFEYGDDVALAAVDLVSMRDLCNRREIHRDMNDLAPPELKAKLPMTQAKEESLEPGSDIVVTVAMYERATSKKEQEIEILGRQTLTALRDALYCLNDRASNAQPGNSACIFVEGLFLDDMRDVLSTRYSRNYISWIRGNPALQPKFSGAMGTGIATKEMASVRVDDLTVRLGAPYVLVHQGECEHVLVFNKVRLLHTSDPRSEDAYPRQLFRAKVRRQRCRVCDIFYAKFVTYNDSLASESPCFFCDNCYEPLHHGFQQGPDFAKYDYYHD